MKRMLLCVWMVSAGIAANGQAPTLVQDIWTGVKSSDPGCLTVYNGKLYYATSDSAHGRELWSYTTQNGAQMVADIHSGIPGGFATYQPEPMAVYNGKLYFGVEATRLMMYDGVNPPSLVTSTIPSSGSYACKSFAQLGGKLYYEAGAPTFDGALYSYDGIHPTVLITGMSSNAKDGNYLPVLIPYKGKIYFTGYDSATSGRSEFYSYDPATNQTRLVYKINQCITCAGQQSHPEMFVVAGSKLYFAAVDSATGEELYSYDGAVVKRLTDIGPGLAGGVRGKSIASANMGLYKGAIYFEAVTAAGRYALYKWDTAVQAASLVYDFNADGNIAQMFTAGSNLYFSARTVASGRELWRYNGTTCGMVADLNPGINNGFGLSNFAIYKGALYFNGDNGETGKELYKIADTSINATGIQSISWPGTVTLHPNPATTTATLSITLQSPQSFRVSLTDISGKEVFTTAMQAYAAGKHEVALPMQGLASGQYFYRISGEGAQTLASGAGRLTH